MLKIYGSMLCGDCVQCREDLDREGVAYEFLDFAESLSNLKEFLKLRDGNPMFDALRAERKIGIPCIVSEHGMTLSWKEFLDK